ncbi:MAG TPA: HAMP domain-containing sensor histidine kinase [Nocardioidaceae bacterium]|nr:HAMP domain-containing sensor histidine kinase [Nocardioidaceae bacterium]
MRRLFVVYGAALTSAVLLALLVPLGLTAGTLARDHALTAARQEAQGLTVLVASANRARLREAVQAVNHGDRRTTVFLPDGTVLGAPAPMTPSVGLARRGLAFTAAARGGEQVLLPVGGRDGAVAVIRTFVPDQVLSSGVLATWATLALVGVFLLGTAVAVGTVLAGRLSRSVTVLADVAERVGAGDLSATVEPAGPAEVSSVGLVLNGLGARITAMLSRERQLGADLSHRLRTPVTALRLDVEALADPQERARMTGHVDALTAAVDAAVTAARSPAEPVTCDGCDAARVVSTRAEFWSVLAAETRRPFTVSAPGSALWVPVSADRLGAALDALLDNVFSHTPSGTRFALAVTPGADGSVDVVVEDTGPGLAEPAHTGTNGCGSTGIGLDLARRTAEQAGGQVTVRRGDAGGARVVMSLPFREP